MKDVITQNQRYNYYGGKGIHVCERWINSFENFLEDMEDSFEEGLELDRIDNSKGYSPENCRWVNHSENMLNRNGFKILLVFQGLEDIIISIMVDFKIIKRIIEQILLTPARSIQRTAKIKTEPLISNYHSKPL